jgi:hypothetical protein
LFRSTVCLTDAIRSIGLCSAGLVACAVSLFAAPIDPSLLSALHWRSIGPAMFAGQVDDVAGVPGNPAILYAAHSTGGLFKSVNAGNTFESVYGGPWLRNAAPRSCLECMALHNLARTVARRMRCPEGTSSLPQPT